MGRMHFALRLYRGNFVPDDDDAQNQDAASRLRPSRASFRRYPQRAHRIAQEETSKSKSPVACRLEVKGSVKGISKT